MEYPGSLHNHTHRSNFRLRDCIVKEEDLINYAIELGHEVIAITDHETISAAVTIEKIRNKLKDKDNPIKIIMGNEIYLCRNDLNGENFDSSFDKYYHFILLARDRIGFQQLCELSTRAWNRSYMAKGFRRVPTYYKDIIEIIGNNPGHVIGSTACLGGMLATQLLKYKDNQDEELWNKILKWCTSMRDIFGGKDYFYLEMQPSATKEQTYVNEKIVEISKILNIDYIITTDTHYLKKQDREVHKAFLKSQNGEREVDSFYATTYLMDTEELKEYLSISKESIEKSFITIQKIKNLCEDYSILKSLRIPSLKWADYSYIKVTNDWINKIPMFDTFLKSDFDGDRLLVKAIINGIQKHNDLQNEEAYNELNENLKATWESSLVNKAHWSAYYLNLQKIIDLCWEAGSLVGPGRGSGVGFLLLYCLDITQINPLREETKCYAWRFLNPERVSVLDVDFDIEGQRREEVLNTFRNFYGQDRVSNVATFKTEKSKSAILTACRGLDIDVDEAQYLASLISADRGQLRTLKETFYGNEEKGLKPNSTFVHEMTENYPQVWRAAQKIENLICGVGIHAGGVIFVDEPFTNSTGLMRAPNGTIITQFDLHESEEVSLIKYDALSVEAMDKLHICLDLLTKHNYITPQKTLKETYEQVIGIYNLERDNPKMWQMIWEHKILALFQMEKQSGIRGISLIKPKSVNELSVLNSVIRLMPPDEHSKLPLETWCDYRKDKKLWIQEMKNYGLDENDIYWLANHPAITDGICESQEGLMSLVQEERLGGNSLTFADKCRKGIAKKQGKLFQECEDYFYKNIKEKGCNEKLAHYIWDVLLKVQRGYSFNRSHCLAYSLVALQEMNLAFKYPTIYWNCACLISDSGSNEANDDEEIKETKGTDYAKLARAIGKLFSHNVKISLVDINNSSYGFDVSEDNKKILFGLKGLSQINDDTVAEIIKHRPYTGIKDFMKRCPLKKTSMVSLIKAGAFDELDREWASKLNPEPRIAIMTYYLMSVADLKNKITLQNLNGLIKAGLVPEKYSKELRIIEFNKYLKKNKYVLDTLSMNFYSKIFDTEYIEETNGVYTIDEKVWKELYEQNCANILRKWVVENQNDILKDYNNLLFRQIWEKYAEGTISAWEMESCCFYYHPHELININMGQYGISDFFKLPEQPRVEYMWRKTIPIYELSRIVGTVISKDDTRSTISLLTVNGVANVKFAKEYYAMFKKRISKKNDDGTKTYIEDGWFKRGNMLMVTGYRNGDDFRAKTYSRTPGHQLYLITKVNGNEIEITHERAETE